jgi:hypothetical protein
MRPSLWEKRQVESDLTLYLAPLAHVRRSFGVGSACRTRCRLARLEWYCDLPRYGNHAGGFYCRCCHAAVIRGHGESSCVATCSRRARPPCSARIPRDGAIQPAPLPVLIIFDDVAKALEFDEKGFRQVVSNIAGLKDKFAPAAQKCLAYFPGGIETEP